MIVTARLVQPGQPVEEAPAPARVRAKGYQFLTATPGDFLAADLLRPIVTLPPIRLKLGVR